MSKTTESMSTEKIKSATPETSKTSDRLESLRVGDPSKISQRCLGIQNIVIRDAIADAIEARASTDSVINVILAFHKEAPHALPQALKLLQLTNASAFRQSLEKGFRVPALASGVAVSGGIDA